MKILIDADGCPVVDIAVDVARRYALECLIICDTAHVFEKDGAKTITVSKGVDSVDFTLVNMVEPGDVIITQDYGLAAMCLAKRGIPISQNGVIYDEHNMDGMLHTRYAAQKIRKAGGRMKGPAKRTTEQDMQFLTKLTELVENLE